MTALWELVPILEDLCGPEHPTTLNARENLAGWSGEDRDPAAAVAGFAHVLAIRERVQGPDHPATVATRRHLQEARDRG